MKLFITLAMVLSVYLLACSQATKTTDNPEILKKVLTSFFDGISEKDTAKIKSITTDDFVLYEDGLVWNNDSGFANIRRHIPFTVKYTLSNFKIYVDNTSGDMTYFNHADFLFKNNEAQSIDWIESATFRKLNGIWKINFLHLTERGR